MRVLFANSKNMDLVNKLLNKDNVVVFFTAPWCGHCKQLKPVMQNVFGRFKGNSLPGTLLNVSEQEMPRMVVNNRINGYPTIRHYHNGQVVNDYNGIRDEKSIAEYLAKIFDNNKLTLNKVSVSLRRSKKRKQKKKTKNQKKKTKNQKKKTRKQKKKTRKQKGIMGKSKKRRGKKSKGRR